MFLIKNDIKIKMFFDKNVFICFSRQPQSQFLKFYVQKQLALDLMVNGLDK